MRFKSIVVMFSMMAIVACGSAKTGAPNPPEPPIDNAMPAPDMTPGNSVDAGSVVVTPDNSTPDGSVAATDSGPKAPTNQTECIAACETTYPKAATESHQLDSTCYFAGVCEPVCNDLVPGKNYPPTNDADAAAPVACPGQFAEGVDPIQTPSAACSTCLANTPACCSLWVEIFGSTDGRSLSKCAVACYTNFKN